MLTLADLPSEILDLIASHLPLASFKQFRLVSRSVSRQITHRSFECCFRKKEINLTVDELAHFIDYLQSCTLAYWIRELTIQVLMAEHAPSKDEIQPFLTGVFILIARITPEYQCLTIRTDNNEWCNFRSWYDRSTTAGTNVLQMVQHSLQQSSLKLNGLHLWPEQAVCAPAVDIHSETNWLRTIDLSRIQSFSFCLTTRPLFPPGSLNASSEASPAAAKKNLEYFLEVMKSLPLLRHLDLAWINRKPTENTEEAQFFERYHTVLSSMNLVSFSLHGAYVSYTSLSQFLARTSARRLTLKGVRMRCGVFADIFEILRSKAFNYLHLDDIWEYRNMFPADEPSPEFGYMLLYFNIPGRAKFSRGGTPLPGPGCGKVDRYDLYPRSEEMLKFECQRGHSTEFAIRSGCYGGPSEIVRHSSDVRLQLPYFFLTARPLGSGEYQNWLASDKFRFGLPDSNFVEAED